MALDKKIMDRVLIVAGVIRNALQDLDAKGTKSLSITRAQLSELIGPDFQFDRNFLLHTTEELAKSRIHLTSVMSTDSKVDFIYYAAFATHTFYSDAVSMKDKSMKRLEASAALTLDSVLELTKFGLTESALAHFTCSSIGHSSILLESKITGNNKTSTRCLRCDRKLNANSSSIVVNEQKKLAAIGDSQIITWRDVVHCQPRSLEVLADIVQTTGIQKHLETPFAANLVNVESEKKKAKTKQDKPVGRSKPAKKESPPKGKKETAQKKEPAQKQEKKRDKPAGVPKALL